MSIPYSSRQIERANLLSHTYAGLSSDASITVRHVCGRFLAVRVNNLYGRSFLHFSHTAA